MNQCHAACPESHWWLRIRRRTKWREDPASTEVNGSRHAPCEDHTVSGHDCGAATRRSTSESRAGRAICRGRIRVAPRRHAPCTKRPPSCRLRPRSARNAESSRPTRIVVSLVRCCAPGRRVWHSMGEPAEWSSRRAVGFGDLRRRQRRCGPPRRSHRRQPCRCRSRRDLSDGRHDRRSVCHRRRLRHPPRPRHGFRHDASPGRGDRHWRRCRGADRRAPRCRRHPGHPIDGRRRLGVFGSICFVLRVSAVLQRIHLHERHLRDAYGLCDSG